MDTYIPSNYGLFIVLIVETNFHLLHIPQGEPLLGTGDTDLLRKLDAPHFETLYF